MKKFLFVLLVCLPQVAQAQLLREIPGRVVHGLQGVLGDIEARMPHSHIYRDHDRATWAHETSHGLAARLRMKFGHCCLYVLDGNVVQFQHPPITMQHVAACVPYSIRGDGYQLYLVQQRRDWNNDPGYICDEWVAYTNGTQAGLEHGLSAHRTAHSNWKTAEFFGYSLVLLQEASKCPNYNDPRLKEFVRWYGLETGRIVRWFYEQKTIDQRTLNWLSAIQSGQDTAQLRDFLRKTYGTEWCQQSLGFE